MTGGIRFRGLWAGMSQNDHPPHLESAPMNGSDHEPVTPQAAADQMAEATTRLREQAWMIAPLTTAAVDPATSPLPADADRQA